MQCTPENHAGFAEASAATCNATRPRYARGKSPLTAYMGHTALATVWLVSIFALFGWATFKGRCLAALMRGYKDMGT